MVNHEPRGFIYWHLSGKQVLEVLIILSLLIGAALEMMCRGRNNIW